MFVPKLVTALRTYDREQFLGDLVAGVIVGVVALPLAIAFAIASGVTPDRGLWTAIVAGFLISALGGSRVQIGGPTGAFVVIVYGIVQKYGIDGLTVATLMAGVILVVMGFAKLGAMIKFIPQPVITGFTSGIALIIFSGEIKDFFGLRMGAVPADFVAKWTAYAQHATAVTPAAIGVSLLSMAIIWLWPRINRRIPGMFIALIVTTIVAQLMHLPVETVGSRFGAISSSLPHPQVPHLSFAQVTGLVGPAFTIALLGAVESLLSAVVSDGMIGGRHRSNMELVAQGVANIASPLFGGIPATGAIARTATNVKNGARTPVAGMIHALTLLLITVFVGRWAALIPMATLAAILVVVSYHMSEWRNFLSELRSPKSDVAVLLVTFSLTVLVDLTVAISVGMVLAAFLFIRRMATVTTVTSMTGVAGLPGFGGATMLAHEIAEDGNAEDAADDFDFTDPNAVRRRQIPAGVEVYEITGPFFFGAAATFKDTLSEIAGKPRVLIIRMRDVPAIDSTAMHALKYVVDQTRKDGTTVLISDIHMQPLVALTGSPILAEIGEENLFGNLDDALNRAREILGLRPVPPPAGATPTVARETPARGVDPASR
ncbi:MAG TPA: SulP family inorganic anion transporter [Candidatus Elarobacter sp.]|nr:SulP family inorganic anion transporter [Candidatus Elarobacter sp.]